MNAGTSRCPRRSRRRASRRDATEDLTAKSAKIAEKRRNQKWNERKGRGGGEAMILKPDETTPLHTTRHLTSGGSLRSLRSLRSIPSFPHHPEFELEKQDSPQMNTDGHGGKPGGWQVLAPGVLFPVLDRCASVSLWGEVAREAAPFGASAGQRLTRGLRQPPRACGPDLRSVQIGCKPSPIFAHPAVTPAWRSG